MSYKSLEQIGTAQVSFHFAVTPGKTECLSNPNSEYCCPKGMVGRPASLEPNGYRFEYTRIGMPTSSNTKQKNMSETTTSAKNPYCDNCDDYCGDWDCRDALKMYAKCIQRIATLKRNGWPLPEYSHLHGSHRDGNYFPCCYLRDMWCSNTADQDDKFDKTIDYMNKKFGKAYGFNIDKKSDDNICKQMGCPNS